MSILPSSNLFLPMSWEADEDGIHHLSWKDDPLQGQLILDVVEYQHQFPQNQLHWPCFGELLLPENTPDTVQGRFSAEKEGETLRFSSWLHNTGCEPVTLSYVRLALPMDQCFRNDDRFKYEQNVLRHTGLLGHCAYLYWRKPGGKPPLYVLVAQGHTRVTRFFVDERYGKEALTASFEGLYALEMVDSPLLLDAGQSIHFDFRLGIVQDEAQLHDALVELGGLGTDVLPGMAVQRGERITLRLQTQRRIESVCFSDQCAEVMDLGNNLYQSSGAGSGEKMLIVHYSDGDSSCLKFFIIDPIREIIHDHARHIALHQFETDPTDPCYHGILAWNMTDRCRVNSKKNPFDNWMAGGSDEIGLVSGLFLSEKNVYWPDEDEIRVLNMHVEDFIEGRLTEQPGNRVHRMVPWFEMFEPWAGHGADDVWRAFNYVHVANICYNMYRIARYTRCHFLKDARHYLRRAYDYATAMFNYWMFPDGEGATKYGNMGEMNLPLKFVEALRNENMPEQAAHLETLMLEKAKFFSTREYPFGSEMAFDTTAYEAVYAYAKLIGDERIAQRAISATLANRARTPVWHKYSVDVRGGGDSCWNVSYMTQLGVWPVIDSLLEGKLADPEAAVMAHAATLAGFCMYNSGGCWDEAPENRHASWWVMDDRLNQGNRSGSEQDNKKMSGESGLGYFGALYCTCAMLVQHPRLGKVALGCQVEDMADDCLIKPDSHFRFRLCDLVHGFALIGDSCEIEQVIVKPNGIQVKAQKSGETEGLLRVRMKEPGKWVCINVADDNPVFISNSVL